MLIPGYQVNIQAQFRGNAGAPLIRTPIGLFLFLRGFMSSYLRSKILQKMNADAMIGFGGFSSLGPALATRLQKIPIFIHEANRAVGKAVRILPRIPTGYICPKVWYWKVCLRKW